MNGGETAGSMGTVTAFRTLMRMACSGGTFQVLGRVFAHPLPKEERAAVPLAGGIMQHGHQCGMLWGAALAAGARAYRMLGAGPRAEARTVVAAARLVEAFRRQNACVNCLEITGIDRSSSAFETFAYFCLKGGSIGCARRLARYAPAARGEIHAALAREETETVPAPASCTAMLVRKMGLSDEHAVMAAGLAGGIGLGGGACGALGAAVWVTAMRSHGEGSGKIVMSPPGAPELVERFLACTGGEFECSKIVGRRFESVGDHARYLCDGGCSRILEALAGQGSGRA